MNQKNFTQPLIAWYLKNKRDLLFRHHEDPYKIWISEIMAQQTQIATMLPYYQNWIEKWPDISSLAQANEIDVLKAWEGLGYYSRARNLLKAAQIVQQNYHGVLPQNYQELRELPGIGDYTAGAISSIAFKQEIPAIDGNVIRVMTRLSKDERDFSKAQHKNELKKTLQTLMHQSNPSDFTQALMELGALICKPTNPGCNQCPLKEICLANQDQSQMQYPFKKKKATNPHVEYNVFFQVMDDQLLISKDDSDGLMKNLSRLPMLPIHDSIPFNEYKFLYQTKHVFSHLTWIMNIYQTQNLITSNKNWFSIPIQEIENQPFVTAHKNIIQKLLQHS